MQLLLSILLAHWQLVYRTVKQEIVVFYITCMHVQYIEDDRLYIVCILYVLQFTINVLYFYLSIYDSMRGGFPYISESYVIVSHILEHTQWVLPMSQDTLS